MDDIKKLISMGESFTLQFKREFPGQDRIADEIVAFANSKGGTIVIGVDDKTGEIIGLDFEEIETISSQFGNAGNEKVRPIVYVETYPKEIDGKYVLLANVPQGISKPYKNLRGEIYVKQGPDKRRITENGEILQLFHDSRQYFPDEEAVKETSVEDINEKVLDEFLNRAYHKSKDEFGIPYQQLLENLRILRKNGELSLSGLLFFGKYPERFVPQFIVKAVAFVGNSLGGTQYRDSRDIQGDLKYVFDECLKFCEGNLHHIQGDQSFNSLGQLEVPRLALEELIQNALIHRSYLINAPIRLLIFDNRIEIVSPGNLIGDLTIESIKLGQALQRNSLLASFCARGMNYRGLGSGIRRAIEQGADLSFDNNELTQQFTVTIYRCKNIDTINSEEASINKDSNRTDLEVEMSEFVSKFGLELENMSSRFGLEPSKFGLELENISSKFGLEPSKFVLALSKFGLALSKFGLELENMSSKFGLEPSQFGVVVTELGLKYTPLGLNLNQILILLAMKEKPEITLQEIAEILDMTKRSVEKNVSQLRDKGFLTKEGGKRYGKWVLIDKKE